MKTITKIIIIVIILFTIDIVHATPLLDGKYLPDDIRPEISFIQVENKTKPNKPNIRKLDQTQCIPDTDMDGDGKDDFCAKDIIVRP